MPQGLGLLDSMLIAAPVLLAMLGLIRGAPVELASSLGCLAGVGAAWGAIGVFPIQALGRPTASLLALVVGMLVWRLARGISRRLNFDARWMGLGAVFDSVVGGAMGGLRGLALVSAACVAYTLVAVPFGFAAPSQTGVYPVFLALGTTVTRAFAAHTPVRPAVQVQAPAAGDAAGVPLPPVEPRYQGPPTSLAVLDVAPAPPMPHDRPEIPVRGIPINLAETHHNILHPFGLHGRRRR